ncbi:MAG: nucleoside:proton symporter [Rhodospirillaceae bacterium]|nr:nucleoside:proton symporter [Rhodospirillaceae bacterium]MDD9998140.1 nucleoside:proton symporter [Rhodospirillaceae bacterium]MDE0362242.1 nucleoside:proton symporter [Rhodospirillaceae bacterium]
MTVVQPIIGLAAFIGLAWCLSEDRRGLSWRLVAAGLAVQVLVALVLIRLPGSQIVFVWINEGVLALQRATEAGTSLVFGFLGGAPLPFEESYPGAAFVLAFRSLPLVLVVSAFSALLYHWRVLPVIVRAFAWALTRTLRIGGAASFATAANIFVGMVESPLLVRPYLERISRADLFMVMTAGLSTIAGTVFVLYSTLLRDVLPNAAGHLLTASVLSAPAAVVVARLMIPAGASGAQERIEFKRLYDGAMDAISAGTIDGLKLLAYIIGFVLVLVALVELANILFGVLPDVLGAPLTLQRILGWVLAPAAWLIGVPWTEAATAGQLLGSKIVLTEFVAYLEMSQLAPGELGDRSRLVLAYAMCGFANFGGLGIMLGGLGALVPSRRRDVLELGMKSLIAGNIATLMTGAVAGLVA